MGNVLTSNKKNRFLMYAAVFVIIFIFLLWKCRYGYASEDEAFYLTIPCRMYRGDIMLIHEWHLSQLFSFVFYPIVKLYLMIFDGTEQIILNFRYVFTVVWAAAALFLYARLRVYHELGAMLASLAFLIYAPFGIMALCYNTFGILFLLSSCTIIATAKTRKNLQYYIAGILFAGAVLCCPYLLMLYLLFSAVSLYFYFHGNKEALSRWFFISCGSATLLAVFCAYFLFHHVSPKEILQVLPRILNDPEYPAIPFVIKAATYFLSILLSNRLFPVCLLFIAAFLLIPYKNRQTALCFAATCLACAALILAYVLSAEPYINFVMFPVNMAVPFCILHSKNKDIRTPFYGIWIPGLIYTICLFWSSDTKFYALSSASTVMTVASIVILFQSAPAFLSELKESGHKHMSSLSRAVIAVMALLMTLQLGSELYLRYSCVFWDLGISAQTELVEQGAERGILMSPEKKKEYQAMTEATSIIKERSGIRTVLFLTHNTVMYLMAEKDYGTFSAYLSGGSAMSLERLDDYYSLFPDRIPDAVYSDREYRESLDHFLNKGYHLETLDSGDYLLTK